MRCSYPIPHKPQVSLSDVPSHSACPSRSRAAADTSVFKRAAIQLVQASTGVSGVVQQTHRAPKVPASAGREPEPVYCIFRWPSAVVPSEVEVTGSFCHWRGKHSLTQNEPSSDFFHCLPVRAGLHQFKFKVDGAWQTSPVLPVTQDKRGLLNNEQLVAPTATFSWPGNNGTRQVAVTGSFTGWSAGEHEFHYLVDGERRTSPDVPVVRNEQGQVNNQMSVRRPPAFYLFYRTGFAQPVLHYRTVRASPASQQRGAWQQQALSCTASRATPGQPGWMQTIVPAQLGVAGLEFYLADGHQEDRPHGGLNPHQKHYYLPAPGGYKLQEGMLVPFPSALSPPVMLVTDLDGTMVGDGQEADDATAAFSEYWEEHAALSGSVLVFNTGRSLGQIQSLLTEKQGKLAIPDALITAVGTKVFLLDSKGGPRAQASGQEWVEDQQYSRLLDADWDLQIVRQVATQVLEECGGDGQAHWLDDGSEHPHRIALSMVSERVPHAEQQLQSLCQAQGLQVQVIVSGTGPWRYVDCVSAYGGKLNALEHVRRLFDVPQKRTVAAGDSGNDILMLAGGNPAIVVGNAQPTLMQWLVMQSQDGRIVLSRAPMARGIVEGLARHGLF